MTHNKYKMSYEFGVEINSKNNQKLTMMYVRALLYREKNQCAQKSKV